MRTAESEWALVRLGLSSRCPLAVLQAWEVVGLGGVARMNRADESSGPRDWLVGLAFRAAAS